jgi:hypothetical protein
MANPNIERRHAAARDCIREALVGLGPALGPRTDACRAYLELALAALGEPGPPAPAGRSPGAASVPRSARQSKPRRRLSPGETVPFPEGWDRRGV